MSTPGTPTLPQDFLRLPVAHRAYHDKANGLPENSREAILAAVEAGYAIEIDLQPSSDGVAMVFHDDDLERLTGATGPIRARSAQELAGLTLLGGPTGIPTFAEVLTLVAGRVPLLVEVKDQDGALGPDVGALEAAAARDVQGYDGPLAFMSFNPHSMAKMAELAPDWPRGLTTCGYPEPHFPGLSPAYRAHLAEIADLERTGASFISHHAPDLDRARIHQIRTAGLPVLCWTIRTAEDEAVARRIADNVTFEHYRAAVPA